MNSNKILPFAALTAVGMPLSMTAADKPNIVIIVADDLGWGDVGYHGSTIKTPNIDRLAEQGVILDRYYTAPISSPARAGLLTGRYPSRFGFREAVIPPWRECGLDEGERTLADMLADNGYAHRAAIGKWHLGHTHKVHYPLNRGFDHFYGLLNGAFDYFTHLRDGELDWHNDWDSCYDEGYSTDLIAAEAVKCINDYSKEQNPFMLYVAFNAPHSPYQAPDDAIAEYIAPEKLAEMPKRQQNGYIYKAMVSRMDKGIGNILAALEKRGITDNTIILFVSDNGGVANMASGSTCAPLRGNKFQEWDGGVRVPAVIRWGKNFGNGRTIGQTVGFVDIMPTLAEIVGDKASIERPYDGMSILSLLKGETDTIDRYIYLGCGAVVNNEYKFIRAGRSEHMKLKEDFLVRYADDPYEKTNAIKNNTVVAKELEKIAVKFDKIRPYIPEQPYNKGQEGFKAPKEWKVTRP